MQLGRLYDNPLIWCPEKDWEQHAYNHVLSKHVHLHESINPVNRLIVYYHSPAGIADQGIDLRKLGELFPYTPDLFQLLKVTLLLNDFRCVASISKFFNRFMCMVCFVGQHVDLLSIMLEEVCADP